MTIENTGTGTQATCDHPGGCARTEFVDNKVGDWPAKKAELERRGWAQDRYLGWCCPDHAPRAA